MKSLGKRVLKQWFSYRKRNRERPIIGDRRPPSALGQIQPAGWLAELHDGVVECAARAGRSRGVRRFPGEALGTDLLGTLITAGELASAAILYVPPEMRKTLRRDITVRTVRQR